MQFALHRKRKVVDFFQFQLIDVNERRFEEEGHGFSNERDEGEVEKRSALESQKSEWALVHDKVCISSSTTVALAREHTLIG